MIRNSLYSAILFTLILSGCSKSEPKYVEVRDVEPTTEDAHAGHDHEMSTPAMADKAGGEPHGVGFAYVVPEGWQQQVPSSMKLLSFAIGTPPELISECAVSAFPGDVGGQLANVNRWRRQVGLGPIAPEALPEFVRDISISGMNGWQVDFTGPAGSGANGGSARLVTSAIFFDGKTWFFKLTGNASSIEDELGPYATFLESVNF